MWGVRVMFGTTRKALPGEDRVVTEPYAKHIAVQCVGIAFCG